MMFYKTFSVESHLLPQTDIITKNKFHWTLNKLRLIFSKKIFVNHDTKEMFYQRMMLQKMRHGEEPELDKVDSCVKLLDLDVARNRKRRSSIPFSIPSLRDITHSFSNLRLGLNSKSPLIPRRNSTLRDGLFTVVNLMNESPPMSASNKCRTKDIKTAKENSNRFTDEQNDEFYTTWKRIQGSRMNLAQ